MSKLDSVFPIAEISEKIPSAQFTTLGMKNLAQIIRLKGMTMFELGLTAWHAAMISGQFNVAPNSLGDLVDRGEPNLLKYVSRALNRKMVFDISYQYATVPSAPTAEPKIQLLIAHLSQSAAYCRCAAPQPRKCEGKLSSRRRPITQ